MNFFPGDSQGWGNTESCLCEKKIVVHDSLFEAFFEKQIPIKSSIKFHGHKKSLSPDIHNGSMFQKVPK